MKSILVALALVAGTSVVLAQDYRCTVRRVAGADMSSSFVKFAESQIGKQFTVDRRTGIMAGTLKNSYLTEPTVVDSGSAGNSYKVLNSLPKIPQRPGSNIYALNIDEYVDSRRKPFVFLENATVYFGECEHF